MVETGALLIERRSSLLADSTAAHYGHVALMLGTEAAVMGGSNMLGHTPVKIRPFLTAGKHHVSAMRGLAPTSRVHRKFNGMNGSRMNPRRSRPTCTSQRGAM